MNNAIHKINNRLLPFLILMLLTSFPVEGGNSLVVNIPKDIYKADSKNWNLGQDDKGIIYVANNKGLLEFDGVTWRSHRLPEETIVRSVLAVSHDSIYTGSFEDFGVWVRNGAGKLKYNSLLPQSIKDKHQNDDYWKIYKVDNKVYFQSFTSIFIYDGAYIKELDTDRGFMFLSKIGKDLYVQTMEGPLNKISNGVLEELPNTSILKDREIRFVLPYKEEGLLIGTSRGGFFIYKNQLLTRVRGDFDLIAKENPNVGILGKNGNYFIGTLSDGVFQIDTNGSIIEHVNADYTLQTNTVLSIFQDNIGDVWLGLDGGIALIRDLPNLDIFVNRYNDVGSIYDAIEWNKHLLLATNHRVFALPLSDLKKPAQLRRWKTIKGTEGQVWKFKLIDGNLFVLQNKGVLRLNADFSTTPALDVNVGVYDMLKADLGGKDYYLYGSYFRLYRSDLDGRGVIDFEKLDQPIEHIALDHLKNLWLSHPEKGIYRCRFDENYNSFHSITYFGGDELPFKVDFFKVGGGIEMYGAGKFYSYQESTDRISDNTLLNRALQKYDIKKVISIKDHFYWGIGGASIVKFSYDGYEVKIYTVMQTEPLFSMVTSYENVAMLNDSTQLLCLDNGIGVLKDGNFSQPIENGLALPAPVITYLFLEDLNGADVKVITPPFLNVHINNAYNSVSCKVLIRNQFNYNYSLAYRLSGVNSDWVELPNANSVSFDRLPVGHYQLDLKSVDALGNSSEVTRVDFVIEAPWYLSKMALLTYFVLLGVIMYLVWWLILRRYRNIHLRKIRQREILRLRSKAETLEGEVESKNAEMFTMTSFIIYKNELIDKLKNLVHSYYKKNNIKSLLPLMQQIDALISQSVNPEDDWRLFLIKFEEKNANFFTHLKESYPDLTTTDLRLCACLKLNMDTKAIASLMNATVRSVENRRYRLRKKMGLTPEQNLNEFLIKLN